MKNAAILNLKGDAAMKPISFFLVCLLGIVFAMTPCGAAADYDFKDVTPEIKNALQNRQTRYYQLQTLKQEGVIGENNKGYVTALGGTAATASMTADENQDRRIIYEALAEQNKLGNTGLLEVQKAFAEVQREKAASGDMIQSPSGDWEKKL